jgi:S-adenosylmethionine/arginine decarboxylase-like enzyme
MALDLVNCRPDTIRDAAAIKEFVIQLCQLIDMTRYGECQVVEFGSGRVAGYSMVQLISTSLISGHFANETNRAYLDVFSCKSYEPSVVAEFAKLFFGADTYVFTITARA